MAKRGRELCLFRPLNPMEAKDFSPYRSIVSPKGRPHYTRH
ncbi:hypothetical protein CCACVL1_14042 [Corchorus capsularis]|uniref:Uncharacterized protein n=1 Tax=Corchorus capsularis TaxID=210143 RepID=A0A1R3I8G0_COCAP|nr:hypothetical protein CCACVL1_14042 [Corchorus capsularis]